jgi:dephospho-CoA kinase
VIDTDRIGWGLLKKGTPTARNAVREFGPGILDSRGGIDRKKLGAIVFARPTARRKLNRIVHPALLREVQRQVTAITKDECRMTNGRLRCNRSPLFVNRQSSIVIVLDAALLFLWNWQRKVDLAVLVSSTRRNKLDRLIDSGLTRTEARNRLTSQLSEAEMRPKADLVIPNNGTIAELKARARRFYRLLQTEL